MRQCGFQFFNFSGIVGFNHALRERGQFFSGKLPVAHEFNGKLNQTRLFAGRQVLDLFNDGFRGHE